MTAPVDAWLPLLRCTVCGGELSFSEDDRSVLGCVACPCTFPVRDGTVRMTHAVASLDEPDLRGRTADSFAFEWERFGQTRTEWERNFLDYMQPHDRSFFNGIRVLDAGTGSGRHARMASLYGASVAAIDLGASIDVARANVPPDVLTVQTDLESLPFEPQTFDLVMSIGVLHHLPNPERALTYLAQFAKPGGRVRIYLYWRPQQTWHRIALRGVDAARRLTTRLPHRLLEALCYPLAAILWIGIVTPYKILRRAGLDRIADTLPLKTYADYPFGVLVNDQFDRFSAPSEKRFTASEVEQMMLRAGLHDVRVLPNSGWVAEGTAPAATSSLA